MNEGSGDFTFIELFAGIGGFRVGLEALGGKCLWGCEINQHARKCYTENFPEKTPQSRGHEEGAASSTTTCQFDNKNKGVRRKKRQLAKNIRKVDAATIPPHDILTAGFPCQPFSRLGAQPGLDDAKNRGNLFLEIVRVLKAKKPPMFLLENVPGLLSTSMKNEDGEKEAVFEIIVDNLQDCGYSVSSAVLDSKTILPQERKRLYIVGIMAKFEEACKRFRFPRVPVLRRGVGQILQDDNCAESMLKHLILDDSQWEARLEAAPASAYLVENLEPASTLTKSYRRHGGKAAGKRHFRNTQQRLKLLVPVTNAPERHSATTSCAPSSAAAASKKQRSDGEGKAAPKPRFFSGRECARLQGFPEDFKLIKEYHRDCPMASLFGNAVSPPMITLVGGAMLEAFWHEKGQRTKAATLTRLEAQFKTRLEKMFTKHEERRNFPRPNLDAGVGASLLSLFRGIPAERHTDLERTIVRCLSSSTGGICFHSNRTVTFVLVKSMAE
mmetsp:Transcript_22391/g.36082  ORF Transcript_22391/g.36082 Transcript_22391/m.36082 type:complete len:498 (-) Transcript_22391:468-1961(-)